MSAWVLAARQTLGWWPAYAARTGLDRSQQRQRAMFRADASDRPRGDRQPLDLRLAAARHRRADQAGRPTGPRGDPAGGLIRSVRRARGMWSIYWCPLASCTSRAIWTRLSTSSLSSRRETWA